MSAATNSAGISYHTKELDVAMGHYERLCNLLNCIEEGRPETKSALIGVLELAILATNNLSLKLGVVKRQLMEEMYAREC